MVNRRQPPKEHLPKKCQPLPEKHGGSLHLELKTRPGAMPLSTWAPATAIKQFRENSKALKIKDIKFGENLDVSVL
jgi:hypothetical protein